MKAPAATIALMLLGMTVTMITTAAAFADGDCLEWRMKLAPANSGPVSTEGIQMTLGWAPFAYDPEARALIWRRCTHWRQPTPPNNHRTPLSNSWNRGFD